MQLIIERDNSTRRSPGGRLTLPVRWDLDGTDYPARHWFEDAAALMTMWCNAMLRLGRGEEAELLHFLEGDFALELERHGAAVRVRARHTNWSQQMELVDLAARICTASEDVLRLMGEAETPGMTRSDLEPVQRMLAFWIARSSR